MVSSTRLSRYVGLFSKSFDYQTDFLLYCCGPYNPSGTEMPEVWAVPISLATTLGIEVSLSSWRY